MVQTSALPSTAIMLVDAEAELRATLSAFLVKRGYEVLTASGEEEALRALTQGRVRLLLSEVAARNLDGLHLLRRAQEMQPPVPVVLMSRFGTVRLAVEALRMGASDYLVKPFELEELHAAVQHALNPERNAGPSAGRAPDAPGAKAFEHIIGCGRWREQTLRLVSRVGPTRATVLLTGESGTGKELVARALHAASPRAGKPFVPVACAALPRDLLESELFGHEKGAFTGAHARRPGRFELADGGTLLLDEIGDIPPELQVKLLRVLQEREFERLGGTAPIRVDVRLLAATNQDLGRAVRQGRFRADLYHRLQVIEIHLSPLRERKEDIPLQAEHFLRRFATENGKPLCAIAEEALAALLAYDWPGNVRELENAIEHAVVIADPGQEVLELGLLPPRILLQTEAGNGRGRGEERRAVVDELRL